MKQFYLKACGLFFLIFLSMQVLTAQPVISSFSPASGSIGTSVTITGTNFGATPADNIVYFGAVKAAVSASTATSLTVIVPAGATYQPIAVTTGGLTTYSAAPFVVTFPGGFTKFSDSSFAAGIDSSISYPLALVCLADFDGDGKADIALSGGGNSGDNFSILIYKNSSTTGKISLAGKLSFPKNGSDPVPNIIATDVDGDGLLDIVFNNNNPLNILIYRNTSSGGTISFDNPITLSTNIALAGLAAGDLDGDGKPELIAGGGYGSVSVYQNISTTGHIAFSSRIDFGTNGIGVPIVTIADMDGDKKPEIIVGIGLVGKPNNMEIVALRNTCVPGTISFANQSIIADLPSGYTNGLAVGDLDGDHKPDIAATDSLNHIVYVFRNTSLPGTLSFDNGITYPVVGGSVVSITDMDGDGNADLAVCANTGLSLFRNLSSPGNISFANKVDLLSGSKTSANCLGDIDGDGKPDIVATNATTRKISILRNKIGESSLKPSGANPVTGDVVKTVTVDATVQQYNGLPYVQRHYDIEPAINPATSTATITLYFTQTDFDNFNAYPGHGYNLPTGPNDISGKSSLRVFQYHGFSTTSDPGGYSGSSVEIDPIDNNIVWNAVSALWEVTFDVTGFSGFFISSTASALPLNLLSFTASGQGNNALLKWTTSNETNTSYFELQRSTDGSGFTGIAKINAAGNSSANLSYQYTDALGTDPVYFYRLKMVDKDAGFSYSGIARISVAGGQLLNIYPNPARDNVTIGHPATNNNAQLQLVDMTGKVLQLVTPNRNSLQTNMNIAGIAAGVYRIIWSDGTKTLSQPLLIQP